MLIAVMTIASTTVYLKIDYIREDTGWTTHTYVVLEKLNLAMAAMVDQEVGVRGYLIAGDEVFLEPYHKGGEAYAAAFAALKKLTSDNPAQQIRLDKMNQSAQAWRKEIAEKEIALMARPETREQARAMEASGAGKKWMDSVRASVAEIDAVERALLTARSEALATAAPSATSTANALALPPAARIPAAVAPHDSADLDTQMTITPLRASVSAMALPIPRPAPVTSAVRFLNVRFMRTES